MKILQHYKMFRLFDNQPIRYGMSSRADGSMLLPQRSRTQETQNNRDAFFQKEGIDPTTVVSPLLVHGNDVAPVTEADAGTIVYDVDGLVTNRSTIVLTITAADCLPVYFFDPTTKTIGLVHAGRRGLVANVVSVAIDLMEQLFDVSPLDLLVCIGPGIGPCHYDISESDAELFIGYPDALEHHDGKTFLNLSSVAAQQCLALAVKPEHIEVSSDCTFEDDNLFSARRDKKDPVEAMVAYLALR